MPQELKETIEKICAGDQNAFRQLVETHQPYAFSLAFRLLCDEQDARDTVQDSFIKVWKNIGSYKLQMKFTTWLYKIVTNSALDKLRARKRKPEVRMDDFSGLFNTLDEVNPQLQIENREMGKLIALLAEELPEKQRAVFVLRDIQGLTTVEVSEILELPAEALKSNLYHARKGIRHKLTQLMNFEGRHK